MGNRDFHKKEKKTTPLKYHKASIIQQNLASQEK